MKSLISILVVSLSLLANNCGDRKFSINVGFGNSEETSTQEILSYLSNECKFAMVVQDESAYRQISENIGFININNAPLVEIFDLILTDKDMAYSFNGRKLKISKYLTKTFHLDYLSFAKRTTRTTNRVQTGSSTNEMGGDSTSIDYSAEFGVWDEILEKIKFILESTKEEIMVSSGNNIKNNISSNTKKMLPPPAIAGGVSASSIPVAAPISSSSKIAMINKEAGLITIKGTTKQIRAVGEYIKELAKSLHKQVLIEANIIEVTYNNIKETGIDWSKFELSLNNNLNGKKERNAGLKTFDTLVKSNYLINYNFDINGLIKFLKSYGDVSLVSSPKVLTLNNQAAIVNVGEEVNFRFQKSFEQDSDNNSTKIEYTYDSRFVGVTLDITPQISDRGDIILKINPVISEISDFNDKIMAPDIKLKRLSSIVRVKDGNRIVIGGLIEKRTTQNNTSVPVLSKIPLLGRLFKYNKNEVKKSEIIIVITPHLIKFDDVENRTSVDRQYVKPTSFRTRSYKKKQMNVIQDKYINEIEPLNVVSENYGSRVESRFETRVDKLNQTKMNFIEKYRLYLKER